MGPPWLLSPNSIVPTSGFEGCGSGGFVLEATHNLRWCPCGQQLVLQAPAALEGAWGDVHLLADLGGRPASVLLLDGPDTGLLGWCLFATLGVFLAIWVLL